MFQGHATIGVAPEYVSAVQHLGFLGVAGTCLHLGRDRGIPEFAGLLEMFEAATENMIKPCKTNPIIFPRCF